MDNSFVRGLQQLKNADPNRAIEVLFQLFNSVGRMDVAAVAAAKQTINLFRSVSEIDGPGKKTLDAMEAAVVVRAKAIHSISHNDERYLATCTIFREVFGAGIFR